MYVCLRTRVIPIPNYEFGTESILFSACGTQISFFVCVFVKMGYVMDRGLLLFIKKKKKLFYTYAKIT